MPRRLTLAAVFAALALPASADGETCTSNGGEWDSPGSWSDCTGTGVPDATDDVVIPSPLTASVTTADAVARSIDLDPGGTISVFNARTLTVGGGSSQFDGRVEVLDANSLIRLNGTSTWASGDWSIGGERDNTPENDPGGKIENAGTLTLGGAVLLSNPGNGQMANLVGGPVQTTGTPTVDVAFDNNGAVNVNAGSLTLARGGTSNGDYAVADGATLVLANTHAISLTGGITGAGTLRLSPGVVTLAPDAAYSPAETAFAGGQLGLGGAGVTGKITSVSPGGGRRGAGTLTVAPGASTLAGIFFAEGGTTTFAPGGTIAATGLLEVLDKDTVVRLNGTTTWSAGTWSIGGERFITNQPGGKVENAGVLNLTHDASATPGNAGVVANLAGGTLNATPPGTATFGIPLLNAGTLNASSGTLNAPVIQSAGTTTVTGTLGSIVANGGVVTGGGTITGLLDNAGGTVRPGSSPGTLSAGSFTQGAGGTLAVEVDGTSAFDILAVTGTANLGGTVAVDRGFDPAPSDVFSFLTAGAVNGTFATLTGGALPGGAALALDYTPTSARLVVDVPAPPGPGTPTIGGSPSPGQTLTCIPGTWTGSPAFAFGWLRDGAPIAGEAAQTYEVRDGDAGHQLRCRVTGSNAGGSATATSAPVNVPLVIIDPTPTPTPTPTPSPTPAPTATPAKQPPPASAAEKRLDRASPEKVAAAFGLPSARRCVSRRNFVIRLRRPRGVRIASAQVRVNRKRVRVRRVNGRFTARVDLRGFPKGRFTVRIRIRTTSERTLDGRRRYRTCASRR